MRVVITGAAGNVGGKLARHLARLGGYELCLIDRAARGDPAIVEADLSDPGGDWPALFRRGDVVVHLGAQASPTARWPDLIGANLDSTINLYTVADRAHVRRVVFASSLWVHHGYRASRVPRSAGAPPDPAGNAYGASKLFGERVARYFAEDRGVDTIAVRLGACRPGLNTAGELARTNLWTQQCWLSNDDCCRGLTAAITCDQTGYAVMNLISQVSRSPWSMTEARDLTGFVPLDSYDPKIDLRSRLKEGVTRAGWAGAARLSRWLVRRD